MKIIKLINNNIPIWSMLDGDHALKPSIQKLNQDLILKPNFLDPLENRLRLETFKDKRNWIYNEMKGQASFAIAKFSLKELESFNTCFSEITFKNFRDHYINNPKGFSINRKYRPKLEKPDYAVKYVCEELTNKLKTDYKKVAKSRIDILDKIDNPYYTNSNNLFVAANRGLIIKRKSGSYEILDATHRLLAYSIATKKLKIKLPNFFYAFYFEEIQT